jgi:hypothetical protein
VTPPAAGRTARCQRAAWQPGCPDDAVAASAAARCPLPPPRCTTPRGCRPSGPTAAPRSPAPRSGDGAPGRPLCAAAAGRPAVRAAGRPGERSPAGGAPAARSGRRPRRRAALGWARRPPAGRAGPGRRSRPRRHRRGQHDGQRSVLRRLEDELEGGHVGIVAGRRQEDEIQGRALGEGCERGERPRRAVGGRDADDLGTIAVRAGLLLPAAGLRGEPPVGCGARHDARPEATLVGHGEGQRQLGCIGGHAEAHRGDSRRAVGRPGDDEPALGDGRWDRECEHAGLRSPPPARAVERRPARLRVRAGRGGGHGRERQARPEHRQGARSTRPPGHVGSRMWRCAPGWTAPAAPDRATAAASAPR